MTERQGGGGREEGYERDQDGEDHMDGRTTMTTFFTRYEGVASLAKQSTHVTQLNKPIHTPLSEFQSTSPVLVTTVFTHVLLNSCSILAQFSY